MEPTKETVDAARGELLLRTLGLPESVANTVRYNADKKSQTVNTYISGIVMERLNAAS